MHDEWIAELQTQRRPLRTQVQLAFGYVYKLRALVGVEVALGVFAVVLLLVKIRRQRCRSSEWFAGLLAAQAISYELSRPPNAKKRKGGKRKSGSVG